MIRALLMFGLSSLTLISGAMAADLPSIKGPPIYAPPPPVFSWSGFYVGINGGGAWDRFVFDRYDAAGLARQDSVTSGGFLGGGQVGFNYQFPSSNFVLGAETDFDGTSIRGEQNSTFSGGPSFTDGSASKLDWLGTARARLGMGFGNMLPYITGGFAYAREDEYRYNSAGGPFSNYTIGSTRTGWTAGAGLEYAITRNLTFKTEYLHVDLGKDSYQTPFDVSRDPSIYHTTHATLNIVRAGLDWKFDWIAPPTPVVPKY